MSDGLRGQGFVGAPAEEGFAGDGCAGDGDTAGAG
jgi:hypothetical protein